MTLPQAALYVIGESKILNYRPIKEIYQNYVWHVSTKDGQCFYVKHATSKWAWTNEVRAYYHLQGSGIEGPALYSAYNQTLIFSDNRLQRPILPKENTLRGAGRMLRRLHDSGTLEELATNTSENTLVLTAMKNAQRNGYTPQSEPVPTHGDVHPNNMIVLPTGSFSHFIDFEEFWIGDPLCDLMIAVIECCRFSPRRMQDVTTWLIEGYFGWDAEECRLVSWRHKAQRKILAKACYKALIDWAVLSRLPEEESDLRKWKLDILSAVEHNDAPHRR